jgi:hypothetical protein
MQPHFLEAMDGVRIPQKLINAGGLARWEELKWEQFVDHGKDCLRILRQILNYCYDRQFSGVNQPFGQRESLGSSSRCRILGQLALSGTLLALAC